MTDADLIAAAGIEAGAWEFRFNNRQIATTTNSEDAKAIMRHLDADETCTEFYPAHVVAKLIREKNEAREEVERLRKDADRYEWLRHGDNDEHMLRFSLEARCGRDDVWLLRTAELDAAIDAAMGDKQ